MFSVKNGNFKIDDLLNGSVKLVFTSSKIYVSVKLKEEKTVYKEKENFCKDGTFVKPYNLKVYSGKAKIFEQNFKCYFTQGLQTINFSFENRNKDGEIYKNEKLRVFLNDVLIYGFVNSCENKECDEMKDLKMKVILDKDGSESKKVSRERDVKKFVIDESLKLESEYSVEKTKSLFEDKAKLAKRYELDSMIENVQQHM